jgi:hypothetical protein
MLNHIPLVAVIHRGPEDARVGEEAGRGGIPEVVGDRDWERVGL